jgi:hypothetical protein
MDLVVPIPQSLPDALQTSPEAFAREARMAMVAPGRTIRETKETT